MQVTRNSRQKPRCRNLNRDPREILLPGFLGFLSLRGNNGSSLREAVRIEASCCFFYFFLFWGPGTQFSNKSHAWMLILSYKRLTLACFGFFHGRLSLTQFFSLPFPSGLHLSLFSIPFFISTPWLLWAGECLLLSSPFLASSSLFPPRVPFPFLLLGCQTFLCFLVILLIIQLFFISTRCFRQAKYHNFPEQNLMQHKRVQHFFASLKQKFHSINKCNTV